MTEIFVRIKAEHKCSEGQAKHPDLFQLDAKIDEIERCIIGTWRMFGDWGDHGRQPKNYSPFVLSRGGELDFGAGYYGSTNLLERKIRLGELFTATDNEGDEYTYQILSICILGEREIKN